MRAKWVLFAAAVVLAAAGAATLALLQNRGSRSDPEPRAPETSQAASPADVSLPGKIRARKVVPVAAPVEGTIEELLVDSGEQVYQGQLLGRIRNTGLEIAKQAATSDAESARERVSRLESEVLALRLEASRARADAVRAQMEHDRAERDHTRQKMLYGEGATPRLAYEKAAKEFASARTERDNLDELARTAEERVSAVSRNLDTAKKVLEEKEEALEAATQQASAAEIHAPVDGLVVARTRQAGEEVTPEVADLFQIAADLSLLEAVVEPEPPALARIRQGQEALIVIAGLADAIPGRVGKVENTQVIVEFVSPNPAIVPGTTAQVRIRLGAAAGS